MKRISMLGGACALVAAALASDARAQSPRHGAPVQTDNYSYQFIDDELVGGTLGTPPPILRGSYRPRRVLLIRPRVRFVAELVDAVEKL